MKRALFQGWFTVGRDSDRAPRKMRCFDAPRAVRREEGAVVTTAAGEEGSGAKSALRGDGGGGARAILIEEGISHLVFKYAEKNHFLRDDKRVDTALLKTIKAMVDGLEVQDRPLALWEKAIKDVFNVFRDLKRHRRGQVIINMDATSITFAKIRDD